MAIPLFQNLQVGRFELAHRIINAPLTRCRAIDNIPHPNAATYYAQRATKGGLLISEATCIAPDGFGYPCVPGIFTEEQIKAWRPIVDAVHAKGAVFFLQIWHTGAISTEDYQPGGNLPVSASAIRPSGELFVPGKGMQELPVPRQIGTEEVPKYVDYYRVAARNALAAGFDGIEIHGANGYLIDQFLKSSQNSRQDQYGGSIENRSRFPLEVAKAVAEEVGADRLGYRLSPFGGSHGLKDDHPYATSTYLVEELNKLGLAYLHCIEPRDDKSDGVPSPNAGYENEHAVHTLDVFRKAFQGTFLSAGGYQRESAIKALDNKHADGIVFGRWFLANPDFVHRLKIDAPLNKYDRATFYTQDPVKGYIDYPFLEEVKENGTDTSVAH